MGILGTEMHAITFLISLFEMVFFFYQIIYYLSRPQDKNRLYYLILLYLLIQYNLVSGLLPDKHININLIVQNVIAYSVALVMGMYFPFYFYKVYKLEKLKFYAYGGSIIFLIIPFIVFFLIPYLLTNDLELCRKFVVIIPFAYGLSFLYSLRKAIRAKNRIVDEPIYRRELISMYMGVAFWCSLPIIAFFETDLNRFLGQALNFDNASQIVEVVSTNTGMLIMTVLFIRRAVKQSKVEYRQLQEFNATLQEKINERTLKLEQILAEREHTFVNLIHETKTPITLIKNYLEDYIEKNGDSEQLTIVKKNINKLSKDITNLFDIERYNHGFATDEFSPVINLSYLLEDTILLFEPYCNRQNIRLTWTITEGISLKANPQAITRVINNVMENAIKFSEANSNIVVSLLADEDFVLLKFVDEGIGIDNTQLENIFIPYFQINNNKKNIQGMGLGLPLVKNIISTLQGKILITSSTANDQKGTTVLITLPRCKETPTEKLQQYSNDDIHYDKEPDIADYYKHEEGTTILVVEDNLHQNAFLSGKLSEQYNIVTALNGKQALEKIQQSIPDIIISDIMMDEMDGFKLAEILSGDAVLCHIPIIFLSARNSDKDKLKGLTTGAIDYIEKPFSMDQVRLKIGAILNQREKQESRFLHDLYATMKQHRKNGLPAPEVIDKNTALNRNVKLYALTRREADIATLLIEGNSAKAIGEKFFISEKTVNTHIRNLYEKLGVKSKFEMMTKLQR